MKPKNFPARKLKRQIAAQKAGSCLYCSQSICEECGPLLTAARQQRSKKRRG